MSDETLSSIWSVEVSGQLYEASLDELAQWVSEGALLSSDKVRRGNLRWIEAGKVPQLMPHFAAKARGNVQVSRVDALISEQTSNAASGPQVTQQFQSQHTANFNLDVSCVRHPESTATVFCQSCGSGFCRTCPSTYGSVKICPECGGMCNAKSDLQQTANRQMQFENDLASGFGFEDLIRAIGHPFKFRSSLFFGALMFAFFTFGRSASAMGGIAMFCASLTCTMMANMLTFGILANTVDSFSQGNIGANFMPDFDDFSLWDDVVHPFFLSIGVYVSSFGVFILVVVFGLYFVATSMTTKADNFKQTVQQIPGTRVYDIQRTEQQSQDVQVVLEKLKKQNEERLKRQQEIANQVATAERAAETGEPIMKPQFTPGPPPTNQTSGSISTNDITPAAEGDTEASVKANEMIQAHRKAQLESIAGKARNGSETTETIRSFLTLAAPLVVLSALALLWGLFYFPAACAVAGYTRSFFATINPLVGLDTIRRLGLDYIKILLMLLLIVIVGSTVGFIVGLILLPFSLPGFGNIPANILMSFVTFYISVVFSCLLGLLLYKNSERLKLLK